MDKRPGTATEQTLGGDLTLAADGSSSVRSSDAGIELTPGTTVDRYVIVSRLGAGAMGVVYAAYDPKLDRKVALKLLRSAVTARRSERHRARLAREAKALARIAHPNVVTVFDVGTFDERVWVAMEFVPGMTLRRWLAASRPSIAEILDVLGAAGAGLQAAHAAGLVHRDFKPDNVMVEIVEGASEGGPTRVGRVRVMDFGLAREDGSESESQALERSDGSDRVQVEAKKGDSADSEALTMLGDLVGTPAYMSPEQHLAEEADARSDQFSFCVVLWEALFRERPFGTGSPQQVGAAILEGRRRSPPGGHDVPRWVIAILERGLRAPREERWPSMNVLLEALDRGRQRGRTRWLMGGASALVLTSAGAFGAWHAYEQSVRDRCELTGVQVQAQWPGRAETIEQSLAAFPPAWEKTRPWLDRWTQSWTRARTEACIHDEFDDELEDVQARAAIACLSAQQAELEALLDTLEEPSAEQARNAVLNVSALPLPSSCVDRERLRRGPWPPANDWAEVEAIRKRIATLRPDVKGDAAVELRERAQDIVSEAQALQWQPLEAEAWLAAGWLAKRQERYDEAETALERAYWLAGKSADDQLAAQVASKLAHLVGYDQARFEEGLRWGAHAEMMLVRLDEGQELAHADLLAILGAIDMQRGDHDRAAARLESASKTYLALVGELHPSHASVLTNLALVHFHRAQYEQARTLHRRSRAIWAEVLGPEHPRVAASVGYEALVEAEQGDPEAAMGLMYEAEKIQEKAYGPRHRAVAQNMLNRAAMLTALDRYEESLQLCRKALSILEESLGPEHPDVAAALNNLATAEKNLERYDDALEHYERALQIKTASQGPEHASVVRTLANIADVHHARGDLDRAQEIFEQTLATSEVASGPQHPFTATVLIGLGSTHLDRGDLEAAVMHLERAASIRESRGVNQGDLSVAHFLLARASWLQGVDRVRARALAERALQEASSAGPSHADRHTLIEAWLAEHQLSERGPR